MPRFFIHFHSHWTNCYFERLHSFYSYQGKRSKYLFWGLLLKHKVIYLNKQFQEETHYYTVVEYRTWGLMFCLRIRGFWPLQTMPNNTFSQYWCSYLAQFKGINRLQLVKVSCDCLTATLSLDPALKIISLFIFYLKRPLAVLYRSVDRIIQAHFPIIQYKNFHQEVIYI